MAILKSDSFEHYTGKQMANKLTDQMIKDICGAVKAEFGVDCNISQSQNSPIWNITISKLHGELIYYQSGAVTEFEIHKQKKLPLFLLDYIYGLTKSLDKAIGEASGDYSTANAKGFTWQEWKGPDQILKVTTWPDPTVKEANGSWDYKPLGPAGVYTTNAPIYKTNADLSYGTIPSPLFTPKQYSAKVTYDKKVPVKSLKEMYENDAVKKVKKVKAKKLTAAEKVKAKAAGSKGGGISYDQLDEIVKKEFAKAKEKLMEDYFKTDPLLTYLKKPQVGASNKQIEPYINYEPHQDVILGNTATIEAYKELLEAVQKGSWEGTELKHTEPNCPKDKKVQK